MHIHRLDRSRTAAIIARRVALHAAALLSLLLVLLATHVWISISHAESPAGLKALGLTQFTLQRLVATRVDRDATVLIEIDGRAVNLRLEKSSVRKAGFRLLVPDAAGNLTEIPAPPSETYRGTVEGMPGSRVGAAVQEGAITATVALADGRVFCVQPLRDLKAGADPALHVVYLADGTLAEGSCPVHEAPQVVVRPPREAHRASEAGHNSPISPSTRTTSSTSGTAAR